MPPSRLKPALQRFVFTAAFLTLAGLSCAQDFGENHVVLKDFEWKVVQSEHFDIHYYEGSSVWAAKAARFLEKHYARSSQEFGVTFKERVPFFLYANANDFQQSNIVAVGDGTGGVTEAFKDRFMVYSDGSEEWLEDVIAHELTHVFEFKILLGGFWKSIRILKLVFYPQWLMEGLSEYGTGTLNETVETMIIRDAATTPGGLIPVSRLQNFAHLKPHQMTLAYKEGSQIVRFIDQEYGRDRLLKMLHVFKERFDTNSVLIDVLGLDLAAFERKFQEYAVRRFEKEVRDQGLREPASFGEPLTRREDDIPQFNVAPAFTPDGRSVAYLSTRRGHPPEAYLLDMKAHRRRRLVGKAFSRIENIPFGNFGQYSRNLSVSPDGRFLAFFAQKNHTDMLFLFDLKGNRLESREIEGFTALAQPTFSPDGTKLAFSGMRDGQTDIYLYDRKTRKAEPITRDPQDDQSPSFSPDGAWLVYSSEVNEEGPDPHQRGFCLLRVADGEKRPLPRLPGRSRDPVFSADGRRLLFVNDSTGVNEIYELELEGGTIRRLTRTIGGNFTPAYVPGTDLIAFASHRGGEMHLYAGPRSGFLDEPVAAKGEAWDPGAGIPAAVQHGALQVSSAVEASATPLSPERPYRFRASTDLFLPAFFFSSPGGLFWTSYWQASDYLGNHTLTTFINYNSGAPFLQYSASYLYARHRPQWVLSAQGYEVHNDYDAFTRSNTTHRDHQGGVGILYPFDRFHRMEILASAETDRIVYEDRGVRARWEFRSVTFAGVRDTSTGRYLMPTEGSRLRLSWERDAKVLGGNQSFEVRRLEAHGFLPLGGQKTLALKLLGESSVGPDARIFGLAGVPGGIRGYQRSSFSNYGRHTAASTAEYRFPLLGNLDRSFALLLPDIYFKAIYGVVFDDVGFAWNSRREVRTASLSEAKNALGLGLRCHVFILQAYQIVLALDWAKQTTSKTQVFYFFLGPSF